MLLNTQLQMSTHLKKKILHIFESLNDGAKHALISLFQHCSHIFINTRRPTKVVKIHQIQKTTFLQVDINYQKLLL